MSQQARSLRKRGTDAERLLWYALRNRQVGGHKFRRQHPVGHYVVDFACPEEKLVVELDGGHHSKTIKYDEERTAALEREGYCVIRFWNNEVLGNLNGVIRAIEKHLKERNTPHPGPLPSGEREN